MHTLKMTLNNEIFKKIEAIARQAGIREDSVDEWATQQIEKNLALLLPQGPAQWMPREKWDALVRGEACSLCASLASTSPFDGYAYTIADLGINRLRLPKNQYIQGECILTCTKHVREFYHLSREEREIYMEDLTRSAQALESVFQPIKMNFEISGMWTPHLYCRLKPRFYGDAAPGTAMIHGGTRLLTPQEYEERVNAIQVALAATY